MRLLFVSYPPRWISEENENVYKSQAQGNRLYEYFVVIGES